MTRHGAVGATERSGRRAGSSRVIQGGGWGQPEGGRPGVPTWAGGFMLREGGEKPRRFGQAGERKCGRVQFGARQAKVSRTLSRS